jgi:hypothetical protein
MTNLNITDNELTKVYNYLEGVTVQDIRHIHKLKQAWGNDQLITFDQSILIERQ